jgi:hypothetical protein
LKFSPVEVMGRLPAWNSPGLRGLFGTRRRYGGPEEINRKAVESRRVENLRARLEAQASPYLDDLNWLVEMRDSGAFVSRTAYRDRALRGSQTPLRGANGGGVTLEISALQFFPWLIAEARQAIERQELMSGRFIRVRNMREQENAQRERPSEIFDYFLSKEAILDRGLMASLERNYLDRHDSVNRTAEALVRAGVNVIPASGLHS